MARWEVRAKVAGEAVFILEAETAKEATWLALEGDAPEKLDSTYLTGEWTARLEDDDA